MYFTSDTTRLPDTRRGRVRSGRRPGRARRRGQTDGGGRLRSPYDLQHLRPRALHRRRGHRTDAKTAAAYEATAAVAGTVADLPLAERLINALAAGHAEGGDKREELYVQSAALVVRTTEDREMEPCYNDLRVDATETPVENLRGTYELAREGFEMAVERYADTYAEDDEAGT